MGILIVKISPNTSKISFTRTVNVTIFRTILKLVQFIPTVLLTHNVKKIKGAAHKNGDIGDMCKRALKVPSYLPPATKLGQSYVFTGVCDSVQRVGST